MIRRGLLLLLAAALLTPATAQAQHRRVRVNIERGGNPFSFEPYVGFFRDAYDIGEDDDRTTYTVGFQLGHRIGDRARLLGTVGYANSDDVAANPGAVDTNVYDNSWILTTVGGEYTIVPGRTNIAIGAQAGAGWRKTTIDDDAGGLPLPGSPGSDDGYSALEVVVPHVTLRHWFTRRAALTLRLQDYMFDVLEGPVDHAPAGTLGVTIR